MVRDYEAEMHAWIAKQQVEKWPPLSERQKQVIRAAFAELHRRSVFGRDRDHVPAEVDED
ncbi:MULTISPECIES: hypothetical protein [Nocardia]|uniref:hypothetical protein n=1 Tax=Nocardia TaxID=1817 RepID=UPI000FDB6B5D|nr:MULTISPECIES: hypothetical protein [Nocardia]MBF6411013.1 hypothetical protein [Nocardia farcinica]